MLRKLNLLLVLLALVTMLAFPRWAQACPS
jgi:hypothetical protein